MDDIKTLFRAAQIATARESARSDELWLELRAMLLALCERDAEFYALAKREPRAALASVGISIPDHLALRTIVAGSEDRIIRLPAMHGDMLRPRDDIFGGGGHPSGGDPDEGGGPVRDETTATLYRTVSVNVEHFYTGGLPIGKKGDDVWKAKAAPGETFESARITVGQAEPSHGARIDAQAGTSTTVHWWFNWCASSQYIITFRFKGKAGGQSFSLRVDHAPELFPPEVKKDMLAAGISVGYTHMV